MELSELIESIDIAEYISQYVELEERNGELWGLSPFKDENTPSFSVRRETGRFYDFSSGIGGTVLTFVKFYNRCSTKEAAEILQRYAGSNGRSPPREKLAATEIFKKYAPPKKHHKQSKVKVYPEDYMERYEKRDDKLSIWEREGISRASLDKFGVHYDSFSDRLVYPIRDLEGKIVNIGGRTLVPDWKEKGIRKYTYFSGWGEMFVIYGLFDNLDEILRRREVILFEGCKSVLLADTWGVHNTAALLTSHLSPAQMKTLARLGVRAVFALDKEVRVRDDHNIKRLKQYVAVEYLYDRNNLTDAKDAPVDKGKEVFEKLYNERLTYR